MNRWTLAITLLLTLGWLIHAGSRADEKKPAAAGGVKLGAAAPDFTLSNSEGKPVTLKDFRGKRQVALVFYPALFRAGG